MISKLAYGFIHASHSVRLNRSWMIWNPGDSLVIDEIIINIDSLLLLAIDRTQGFGSSVKQDHYLNTARRLSHVVRVMEIDNKVANYGKSLHREQYLTSFDIISL